MLAFIKILKKFDKVSKCMTLNIFQALHFGLLM